MKILLKLMTALVLTTSTVAAHAEINKVIMSNSDAATMMADRYAKKNGMSSEAARRELTEAGVFKDADGGSKRTAAAPAQAREATVYATAQPTPQVVETPPTVVASKSATAPVVAANSKTPEAKTAPAPAVATAKAVPDATTVLVAAAPVVLPPFVMQIEKMVMADGGFATWQWLTLLSLLAALVLMRWFKKTPPSIVVNPPAAFVSPAKSMSAPVHVDNLSFYVPVVLDNPPAKPAKVHVASNAALGANFKTPLSKLHEILSKADEVTPVEIKPDLAVLNINAGGLPKNVVTPNIVPSASDMTLVFGRSRAQDESNQLFGTNFKTPKSRLRDLVATPSSTLTQADV